MLHVADFGASLAFYSQGLGLRVERLSDQLLLVTGPGAVQLLLAASGADLSRHGEVPVSGPGAWVYLHRPNLPELGAPVTPYPGYRHIQFTDPDGYVITFWESLPLSDEEILSIYKSAPARLEGVLAGVTGEELARRRAPGKWTLRQIVHHIVDSDLQTFRVMQIALALSGREIQPEVWNPDDWMAGLRCEQRPIAPAVALFRGAHEWVGEAVHALPDGLDRWVSWPSGYKASVRQLMRQVGGHALHHIGQIEELRSRPR